MGVYIKMEMPTNCEDCIFCDGDACLMHKPDEFRSWTEEYKNCPLVPVPEHGDLIDRAALLTKALPKNPDAQFHCVALKDIVMAPTIIEADDKDINAPNKEKGEQ